MYRSTRRGAADVRTSVTPPAPARTRSGAAATLLAALALAIGVAPSVAQETGTSTDVRMFRGDPAHSGVLRTRGVERLGKVAWELRTDGPIRSTPALADGVLYFGSGDGHLYAVRARDGRVVWRFDAGWPVNSSPAVHGDLVIFADRSNTVYAVDRTEARAVWAVETGPDLPLVWGLEGWDYIGASPVLAPGADGRTLAVFGSGDGSVRAVDAATGASRWRFDTEGRIRATPAVADGRVYIGSGDGRLYALDLDDGALAWAFETEGIGLEAADFGFDRTQIQSSAAVAGGVVYFGSRDASLYAVDAATGTERWHMSDGTSWIVTSPSVRGDLVISARSSNGRARAVDARSGEERWVVSTGGPVFSAPVLVDETVYVGSASGWVYALSAADGSERWKFRTDRAIYGGPIVADGRLYVGSDDGTMYALEAAQGPQPRRAVFWDDSLTSLSVLGGQEEHRRVVEHFERHGYERLDADGLVSFLAERTRDRVPSVVVFAMDALPARLAEGDPDETPLRAYLEAGGKIVWLGAPPELLVRDAQGRVTRLDRARPSALLGVDLDAWNSDEYGVTPTAAGRRWGLEGWFVARPSAAADAVDVVLATDELGRAAAWAQSYGGPPGTGFVSLPASTDPARLDEIRRVAEVGVMRDFRDPGS